MKSAITIILSAALFSFGHAQVASLLNEAKEDAAYLESGFQGECYSLKFGNSELKGAASEMSATEVESMLLGGYKVVAAEGCAGAGPVANIEIQLDYASGISNTMSFEELNGLQEAGITQRLVLNLSKVTVKNIRFKDESGALQSLPEHVITVR